MQSAISTSATDERAALDAVFCPRQIAVFGASADSTKFGSQVFRNLQAGGYSNRLVPITRSASEVFGIKAFASLRDVSTEIDLVLLSVPVQHVAAAIEDAAAIAAKAAVIYTAGFQEVGEEGRALQDEVVRHAAGKVRLIGPNCLGVRNFHLAMNASPASQGAPVPGNIAFISQSGAFGNAATAALTDGRVGLSKLASVGNMADLSHAHMFRYLAEDPETDVVAAFVEGVPDVSAFLDAVVHLSRSKPVVILKGGRSPSGQRAALSHTGSLAGDGRVWDSLLCEAGATVANSSQELFDAAIAFSRHSRRVVTGRRAAIFSLAGGPGVVAADHCDEFGIELPPLADKLQSLRAIVPPYAALGNPVEVTGQTKREHLQTCAQAIIEQPVVDGLIGIAIGLDFKEFANALIEANKSKPVVSCVVAENSERILAQGGVPNFPSVDRAVRALHHVMARSARHAFPAADKFAAHCPIKSGVLSEADSKAYLAQYGLPVTREQEVTDAEGAVAAAGALGYPVALKVSAAEIAHKSDVGGVILNITDADGVRTAAQGLNARFPGAKILVQTMVGKGVELIVGGRRTQATGPVVMVGIGGVWTEVLDDVVFCRAPASIDAATAALGRLRSRRLLDGYRGGQPVDRRAVASVIAGLSAIMVANPWISEVDINPLIVTAEGAIIVDALIRADVESGSTKQ